MTLITLELPDNVAKEAESAGLLKPERITYILEEALRREAHREFFGYSEEFKRLGGVPMTEEEVMAEVKAARAERRARRS